MKQAFVVSGRLDEIGHDRSRFRLVVGDEGTLLVRLDRSLDVESLRTLWGRRVTVQGTVHFKSNGRPRLMEARRVSPRAEGDGVFESLPSVAAVHAATRLRDVDRICRVDPMVLWGTWPGDEPIEELLAQLD